MNDQTVSERGRRKERHVPDVSDPRPTIKISAGEIERIVDAAESALLAAGRGLYKRGGVIVFVDDTTLIAAGGKKVAAQRISPRGDFALVEDIDCAATWIKFDARARDDVNVTAPMWVAKTLAERGGASAVPCSGGCHQCADIAG
jgi:putative DNA primase/helicase